MLSCVRPSYAVYRPISKSDFLPDFVDTLLRLRPYVDEFKRRSTGIRASRLRLYPDKFLRIPLLRPSLSEQIEIVSTVQVATSQLSEAIEAAQRQIDLLQEYRAGLIEDVVTGKYDVRAVAARLSDNPDEIEEPDETETLFDVEEDNEDSEPDPTYAEAAP